jgi:hypothetical protein
MAQPDMWRARFVIDVRSVIVYEPERVAAAREGDGSQLPGNHWPLFAPVPKPTIESGVEAMTLAAAVPDHVTSTARQRRRLQARLAGEAFGRG